MDHCILEREDKDGYLDEDGCPDPDNDADGILDGDDHSKDGKKDCKNDPEDMDGFEDEDGCPDPDNDQDGVLDVNDHCPNTPGIPGGDHPGCPKKHLAIVTAKEIKITQQIQFATASWIILPVSFKILDDVADILKENPKVELEVQGHTDNVGGGPYNMWLSNQRANSVMRYLVQHGIAQSRLTAKGYGLTMPLVPNDSEANRQINRRVQFIIQKGMPGTGTQNP
jgi:outer membrane protein OmpA-like peptidoglycan-associated protein